MKTSKVLLENVVPITIGAFIIVVYFFFTDKFYREPELENCESCFPSTADYLLQILMITLPSSLYQIFIGRWILKRNENSFKLNIFNCFVFAIFFIGIFVIINLFQRKIEWEFFPIFFLGLFLLGLFYAALMKLFRKLLG